MASWSEQYQELLAPVPASGLQFVEVARISTNPIISIQQGVRTSPSPCCCSGPHPHSLQLAKRLYGIDIKPVQQKLSLWHQDVKVFAISDEGSSQPIAYFYADQYARPGQKQSGAWVSPFWDRARYVRQASPAALQAQKQGTLYATSSNATAGSNKTVVTVQWTPALAQQQQAWLKAAPLQVPLALLVTNQNPPADGKPSLMSIDDAETLFHEFGHALQHLLTRSEVGLTAGMRWAPCLVEPDVHYNCVRHSPCQLRVGAMGWLLLPQTWQCLT